MEDEIAKMSFCDRKMMKIKGLYDKKRQKTWWFCEKVVTLHPLFVRPRACDANMSNNF
jgi:hypothetical protein